MAKRPRVAEFGIDFSGPAETAVGWAIPVPAVFRRALDILWMSMMDNRKPVQRWTQGLPPAYGFEAGDIFYDPPEVRVLPTNEAVSILRRTVQVVAATPDQETDETVISGEVTYRVWDGSDHAGGHKRRVTQAAFVNFLRTGIEPEPLVGSAAAIEVSFDAGNLRGAAKSRRRWQIDYRDAEGEQTTRIIRPLSLHRGVAGVYVRAWCERARATRTFVVGSIAQLVDLDTGEIIEPDRLPPWLATNIREETAMFDDFKGAFHRTAETDAKRHRKTTRDAAADTAAEDAPVHCADLLVGRWLRDTTFTIEYGDGAGNFTRRRVRWINLKTNGDRVLFYAFCHSAWAPRTFRYDRIRSVIDDNGEVHDTQAFFDDLGITWKMLYGDRPTDYAPQPPAARPAFGMAQLDAASPGITVLAALSHSDGFMHEAEVAVIVDYVAARADVDGIDTTDHDRSIVAAYLRRLFPTEDNISRALAAVKAERPHNRKLLLTAADKLVSADGVLHDAEMILLYKLMCWLKEDLE